MPRSRNYISPVDEKAIGQRLQALRKRRGKTQSELAEALGIDQSLVSAYERGAVRPHGPILAAFAIALRGSADEILGLKEMHNGTVHDRRFLRRLERVEKLPRRAKQSLLSTIDTYLDGVEKKRGGR